MILPLSPRDQVTGSSIFIVIPQLGRGMTTEKLIHASKPPAGMT